MSDVMSKLRDARQKGVPLIAVNSPDAFAFIGALLAEVNGNVPVVVWDCVNGWVKGNDAGRRAILEALPDVPAAELQLATVNIVQALSAAVKLPGRSILVCHGMHRIVDDIGVIQAVMNLREPYKASERTLVMLGSSFVLPGDLEGSVHLLDEPYPTRAEIGEVITGIVEGAREDTPQLDVSAEDIERASDALVGIAKFPAEQGAALSLSRELNDDGSVKRAWLDIGQCWERKYRVIESTEGLTVDTNSPTFDEVGGMDNARDFARDYFAGPYAPKCIVRVDEIEKLMGGAGVQGLGDSSGVSQDSHGVVLKAMEKNKWVGMMLVGPPGSGKTLFTEAVGGTFKVPTIAADFGAAKGGIVGESERKIRALVKTVLAIGGERVWWLATCNKLDAISPELLRRYTHGIWYFDLLADSERPAVWAINRRLFAIPAVDPGVSNDVGWTGAEIRNCCRMARDLGCSLEKASRRIVPVIVSDPQSILKLRQKADGRFTSASYDGVYRIPDSSSLTGRRMSLGGE